MINLAINGFGRIGRLALRIALNYPDKINVVAVNTSGSIDIVGWAHLFQYDTTYGQYLQKVSHDEENLIINQQRIPLSGQRDPIKLPWQDLRVDVVLESTGVFRDSESAGKHLKAGAKKVIISAPAKSEDIPTYLIGVNHQDYQGEKIIDNASCTTNCIAPVLKVFLENFGLQAAFLNTIHAYTSTQELQDGSHQDLRRARAAAQNLIPTTTGATSAVIKALPQLKGKIAGLATRIPLLVGSFSDLTLQSENQVSVEAVNQTFIKTSQGNLKGILGVTNEPLVSSDIIGSGFSALVDLKLTQCLGKNLVKVIAWYDNEWAYAQRLIDLALWIGEK